MTSNKYFIHRDVCPACKSSALVRLYSSPYVLPPLREYLESFYEAQGGVEFEYLEAADFTVMECQTCGLVFQDLAPTEELSRKIYEQWIQPQRQFNLFESNHTADHYRDLTEQLLLILDIFERKGMRPQSISVLDFGMGWGDWCRMAAGFGLQTFGAELSDRKIDHAKKFGVNVVNVHQLPGAAFHFINAEQVFEHLPQPLDVLECLVAGLARNGVLRISVPDGTDIRRRLMRMDWRAAKYSKWSLNAIAPLEHLNCFSGQSLRQMVESAKLRQLKIGLHRVAGAQVNWTPGRPLIRNLLRPLFRNNVNRRTALFFEKK